MFYFGLIRKYVVLVGLLLNDMRITRTINGEDTELIKVPLMYSPKDKLLERVLQDPDIDRQASDILPMISYEMVSVEYDGARKLNGIVRNIQTSTSPSKFSYQYSPVAYNINFVVRIVVKNTEDGAKIVEQILPYFTPDWTMPVNMIPELGMEMNIPVILGAVRLADQNYDGEFAKRRLIVWELDLQVKGFFFGPIKQAYAIQMVSMNLIVGDANNTPSEVVSLVPGLTSNGEPSYYANTSIPYQQIAANTDFGYITQIVDTDDR